MLAARLTAVTGTVLLFAAVLCRLCQSSRQPQSRQQQLQLPQRNRIEEDRALLEISAQPADQVLQRLAEGDTRLGKLAAELTEPARRYLAQRLFNSSSQKMRTLQTGIDLCWSLTGVSCVCAHLQTSGAMGGGYTTVRDFLCASILSDSDCAAAKKTGGGCAKCPAEFEQAGRDCVGPDCVATCQCRCSGGAGWPSKVRPCSDWCSSSPNGGSGAVRDAMCKRKGATAAVKTNSAGEKSDNASWTSNRLWNGVLVCAFLLMCLVVAAYGCRLWAHCSRLCAGLEAAFAALKARLGINSNFRFGFAFGYAGRGGGDRRRADYSTGDNPDDTDDYDSSDGGGAGSRRHERRRRRRDRRGRERTGSFLSLSCAESINVVSPTDLILPSYREEAPARLPAAGGGAAPPSYEEAQQEQRQDREYPPPSYSELFDHGAGTCSS